MVEPAVPTLSLEREGTGCVISVGPVPGRSSLAVTVTRGSVIHTVAYCRTIEAAQILIDGLRCLVAPWVREESDDEPTTASASRVHDG